MGSSSPKPIKKENNDLVKQPAQIISANLLPISTNFKDNKHCIQQRKDKQEVDSTPSKDRFVNVNRNIQCGRLQQRQKNHRDVATQTEKQYLKQNYCHAETVQFQPNIDHSYQLAQKLLPPTLLNIQQQRKSQEMKQNPKGEEDYIDIYNQFFNTQAQGIFSNQLPCKHSKCQTVANINAKGDVGCENGCPSYPIDKAIFNNKENTIFRCIQNKHYDTNQYSQITNCRILAQILGYSLEFSNKSKSEQDQFSQKLTNVMIQYFIKNVKQNNQ